jgi:hypothetical protein
MGIKECYRRSVALYDGQPSIELREVDRIEKVGGWCSPLRQDKMPGGGMRPAEGAEPGLQR